MYKQKTLIETIIEVQDRKQKMHCLYVYLHKISYKVRAIINSFYYVTDKEGPVTLYF